MNIIDTFKKQSPGIKMLVGIIICLVIARLVIVIWSPPGFFLDEAATGAHVVAMLQHATNAHGQSWPLFSASLGGGYTTPIYLYPLTLWSTVFGTSELALRYFSVVMTLFAVFIMSLALRHWLNGRDTLIFTVVALSLPWGWLQGSIAWDPAIIPFFVAVAFYSFTRLYDGVSGKQRLVYLALFPLALLSLAYLYPPARVSAPLLFIAGYAVLTKHHIVTLKSLIVTIVGSSVVAIPLLLFIIQPEALGRSQALSVFHHQSFFAGIGELLANMVLLLNPLFLFITGDPNLRHSTGVGGMLGIASLLPILVLLVCVVFKRGALANVFKPHHYALGYIAVFAIGVSFLGTALTNEGQPHSLRACSAWLFFAILITLGWRIIISFKSRSYRIIAIAVAVIGVSLYMIDLTFFYPARAAESFDASIRRDIVAGQPVPQYPDLARQYYQSR